MKVNGHVTMIVTLNVIGLETEAVEKGKYGKTIITDLDQFFMDWVNEWNAGKGELLGASDDGGELEVKQDDNE